MSYLNKLFLFICTILLWTTTDVVQSKFIYRSDVQRWIGQNKIVATWEEAKQNCDRAGAILASPINEQLLEYMKSYIHVNGHTNAYFIGTKLRADPEPQYVSIEGIQIDDMPEAVYDMIDQLDPRDGNCLSMNRDTIRLVPCWNRLPYICYTGVTTNGTLPDKPTEVEKTTAAVGTHASNCNHTGYVYYPEIGRCYRLNSLSATWDKANTACNDEGGYLVILNDETEAKIVTKILVEGKEYDVMSWVGVRNKWGDGDWRSIHGQPLSEIYHKLHDSETTLPGYNLCVNLLSDGTLDEFNCNFHLSYICEKDPI